MTYTQSTDGFGDRDDIALERDRSEGTKRENYYSQFHQSLPTPEYSENGMTFRQVFTKMLTNNSMCALYYKEQIAPCDDIHEAFSDAWASLIGSDIELDGEDTYCPSVNDLGHEIEIRLI